MTSFPEGESGGAMPHGAMPLGMNSFLIMVSVSLLKTPQLSAASILNSSPSLGSNHLIPMPVIDAPYKTQWKQNVSHSAGYVSRKSLL